MNRYLTAALLLFCAGAAHAKPVLPEASKEAVGKFYAESVRIQVDPTKPDARSFQFDLLSNPIDPDQCYIECGSVWHHFSLIFSEVRQSADFKLNLTGREIWSSSVDENGLIDGYWCDVAVTIADQNSGARNVDIRCTPSN